MGWEGFESEKEDTTVRNTKSQKLQGMRLWELLQRKLVRVLPSACKSEQSTDFMRMRGKNVDGTEGMKFER